MEFLPSCLPLVIIRDLDVFRAPFSPNKANPVLLVDSDAVLAFPVSRKCLQSIAGGNLQFLQRLNRIELIQFSRGDLPELLRTGFSGVFRIDAIENSLGGLISERFNHINILARLSCYRKIRLLGLISEIARPSVDRYSRIVPPSPYCAPCPVACALYAHEGGGFGAEAGLAAQ